MLTDSQIENALQTVWEPGYYHEHPDSVRIAYQWLDAQPLIRTPCRALHPLKHMIEQWAGRYVSEADVVAAAYLHPLIKGTYPRFNIGSRLVDPSVSRLRDIPEAFTQSSYYIPRYSKLYSIHE